MSATTEIAAELRRALEERDEARAELERRPPYMPSEIEWANRVALAEHQCATEYDARKMAERERDEARATIEQIRRVFGNALAFDDARGDVVKMAEIAYRGACEGDKASGRLRDMTRQRDEAQRARDQYLRERDQARLAEERARESLDELDEVIYDCLPSDDDDDSPLDCVERAADRLRELAQDREKARADAERYLADLRRCAAAPYEHAKERAEAFRQGAETMREACARWVDHWVSGHVADKLRDMPIPGEP